LSLAKETGISNSKVVSLKDQKALKTKYIWLPKHIDTTGVTQISTSDPDSQIMTRANIWTSHRKMHLTFLLILRWPMKMILKQWAECCAGQNHLGTQQFYSDLW
jgi:hypothetical protein